MLRYSDQSSLRSLRYLEFLSFDETYFANALAEYLRKVFYTDSVFVEDGAQRKTPTGALQPASQIFVAGIPVFDIVTNNPNSCFVGISRGSRESVYSAEAILDAFLNHYMQPREYLEVEF